jgi:hypothetical protein
MLLMPINMIQIAWEGTRVRQVVVRNNLAAYIDGISFM